MSPTGTPHRCARSFYGKVKGPGGTRLTQITVIVADDSPSESYIVDLGSRTFYGKLL